MRHSRVGSGAVLGTPVLAYRFIFKLPAREALLPDGLQRHEVARVGRAQRGEVTLPRLAVFRRQVHRRQVQAPQQFTEKQPRHAAVEVDEGVDVEQPMLGEGKRFKQARGRVFDVPEPLVQVQHVIAHGARYGVRGWRFVAADGDRAVAPAAGEGRNEVAAQLLVQQPNEIVVDCVGRETASGDAVCYEQRSFRKVRRKLAVAQESERGVDAARGAFRRRCSSSSRLKLTGSRSNAMLWAT